MAVISPRMIRDMGPASKHRVAGRDMTWRGRITLWRRELSGRRRKSARCSAKLCFEAGSLPNPASGSPSDG